MKIKNKLVGPKKKKRNGLRNLDFTKGLHLFKNGMGREEIGQDYMDQLYVLKCDYEQSHLLSFTYKGR